MLNVEKVGHLVLRVESLDRALEYYCGVLGLSEVARGEFGEGPMAFLSTGNSHHDLALVEQERPTRRTWSPLHHFAMKVGDSFEALAAAKGHLEAAGAPVRATPAHGVSHGVYTSDPDGNIIELYVDADPQLWHDDPSLVATSEPLEI